MLPPLATFGDARVLLRDVAERIAAGRMAPDRGNALRGIAEAAARLVVLERDAPPDPEADGGPMALVDALAERDEQIERLERELGELRAALGGGAGAGEVPGEPAAVDALSDDDGGRAE